MSKNKLYSYRKDFLSTYMVHKEIIIDEGYNEYIEKVPRDGVIWDIGANIGIFAIQCDELHDGNISVYSFEPIPDTYKILCKNLKTRENNNLHAFPFGLSDQNQEDVCFNYFSRGSAATTMGNNLDEKFELGTKTYGGRQNAAIRFFTPLVKWYIKSGVKERKCGLRTISSVIRSEQMQHIDLMKIDVECAELDVLRGIEEEHFPLIKNIYLEVENYRSNHLNSILDILKRNGYQYEVVGNLADAWVDVFARR